MDNNVTTVHITKPLTTSRIIELLDMYPNLEEITCAPSVYERTSQTYIDVLSRMKIKIVKKYKWGAKSQTDGIECEVRRLSDEGLEPCEIAEKMGITLNRVYYLLKKSKASFDNRKRKHSHEEVRRLREEGLKPREISEELDIPIRTVYYILNNK